MNPAFSVIFFTTLAGAAQGLVVALALATLGGVVISASFLAGALALAFVMLLGGLGASFMHLGRPERAWRAAMMWRTSWLSREVIVLPAFIGTVGLWWLAVRLDAGPVWRDMLLPLAGIAIAALLWYCTAMIYACLRFIEEWSHPLTLVNYTLIGLASGSVLCAALAAWAGEGVLLRAVGPWALVATGIAGATRALALRRNAALRPKSTLQSATGIAAPRLVQTSMGMSAGSFNTREFFHRATPTVYRQIRLAGLLLLFALPAACMLWALFAARDPAAPAPWLVAMLLQVPGLLADRWFFFAQARHPQNLYYQVVS
ncbi:MAG: DmsC/YnfH family molybdoenzyme membrane anchor subunit [Caldimonas sp.]